MSATESPAAAPSFDRRKIFIDRVDSAAAIAAQRQTLIEAVDASLDGLRQEYLRTMSLIRRQRTTSVYRRAAVQAARASRQTPGA